MNTGILNQKGKGIEQSGPGTKRGSRNNKENTNGGNPGNGKPRKEVRNYIYKHQKQNTRDRVQNLRHRRKIRRN